MLWPKKNSYKDFDSEKKFLRLENSPPPRHHNFSNGPSLSKPKSRFCITVPNTATVSKVPGQKVKLHLLPSSLAVLFTSFTLPIIHLKCLAPTIVACEPQTYFRSSI